MDRVKLKKMLYFDQVLIVKSLLLDINSISLKGVEMLIKDKEPYLRQWHNINIGYR